MAGRDTEKLRGYLRLTISLQRAMETMLRAEDVGNVWKYGGYREFARKYVQLVELIGTEIQLPSILDTYDIAKMPGSGATLAHTQKAVFEGVYANLSLLIGFLETDIDLVGDEFVGLVDFLQSRLRSAIFSEPSREKDVQDAIEQLFIGRGMQKGQDYDREVGRVKVSVSESIPDFIVAKLSLALEVKFVKNAARMRRIVDEISADIASYSRMYQRVLFVVYDLGHIRDEVEFRHDLEIEPNVFVVIIKH